MLFHHSLLIGIQGSVTYGIVAFVSQTLIRSGKVVIDTGNKLSVEVLISQSV